MIYMEELVEHYEKNAIDEYFKFYCIWVFSFFMHNCADTFQLTMGLDPSKPTVS
jgi:hypothetical protein